MSKQPFSYIDLPIYSIATYRNKVIFSGGGGHGISNQILIFDSNDLKKEINKIETQNDIIENMVVNSRLQLMACTSNEDVLLFKVEEEGANLRKLRRWRADTTLKNPTLNATCWSPSQPILAAGGDDCIARVYSIDVESFEETLLYQNMDHVDCLKQIDMGNEPGSALMLSLDRKKIVISNYNAKEVLRRVYNWDLEPKGNELQCAYFVEGDQELLLVNYIGQGNTFVGKSTENMKRFQTKVSVADQSCLSAKNGKYIAIATGNGTVQLHRLSDLSKAGRSKKHDMVIKGICFLGEDKVVSGTPESSPQRDYTFLVVAVLVSLLLLLNPQGDL